MSNIPYQGPSERFDNMLPSSGRFTIIVIPDGAESLSCNRCQYSVKNRASQLIGLYFEQEFQPICSLGVDENDLDEEIDLRNGGGDLRRVSQYMLLSTPQGNSCPDRVECDGSREGVKIKWLQNNSVSEEHTVSKNY